MDESTPLADDVLLSDPDLRIALESAFGPGALDLISDDDEPASTGDAEPCGEAGAEPAGAPEPGANDGERGHQNLLLFELAGGRFGIPLNSSIEIQNAPHVTPLTSGPEWLRGLTNLRGAVLPVVDMRLLLGRAAREGGSASRMIVARPAPDAAPTGLIVDSVSGLRGVAAFEPGPADDAAAHRFISSVIECDGQPVAVLDLRKLLQFNARQFQAS